MMVWWYYIVFLLYDFITVFKLNCLYLSASDLYITFPEIYAYIDLREFSMCNIYGCLIRSTYKHAYPLLSLHLMWPFKLCACILTSFCCAPSLSHSDGKIQSTSLNPSMLTTIVEYGGGTVRLLVYCVLCIYYYSQIKTIILIIITITTTTTRVTTFLLSVS